MESFYFVVFACLAALVVAMELSKSSKDRIGTSSSFNSFMNNYIIVYSLMMGNLLIYFLINFFNYYYYFLFFYANAFCFFWSMLNVIFKKQTKKKTFLWVL